ncbi:MAG: LamG domain-containing protein, partial [Planctomycetota bacterium]
NDYDVTPVAPSDAGLVAHYKFENNLLDSSGNGNHGDPCGVPSYVPGQVGSALEFHGDDSVDTGYTEDLPNWTVSAWVTSPAAPSGDAASGPVHREQNFQFNWNHGDPVFRGAAALSVGGSWYAASYSPLEANTWYHLAATYDGNVLKAYRDGFLITSNSAPSGSPDSESNSLKLGRHAAATNYFTGTVDEVRIYSRALPQAEIGSLAGKTTTYTQDLYLMLTPQDPAINMNGDGTIDLKDYAVLADIDSV